MKCKEILKFLFQLITFIIYKVFSFCFLKMEKKKKMTYQSYENWLDKSELDNNTSNRSSLKHD